MTSVIPWLICGSLKPTELHTDPDAHRLLRTLKGRGLALGVISNHYGALEDHLRNLGLDMYWDVALDSGKLGVRKPDPRIFQMACNKLGIQPGDAMYVGDEPWADIGGALSAGMEAVLIDPLDAYAVGYCGLKYWRI
ncbi:MAG TPA: HAD-IA family hydrolase [Firmicutes bacterium]|nr:HAD-IA family hydrolase [Bacillota bacterium]